MNAGWAIETVRKAIEVVDNRFYHDRWDRQAISEDLIGVIEWIDSIREQLENQIKKDDSMFDEVIERSEQISRLFSREIDGE